MTDVLRRVSSLSADASVFLPRVHDAPSLPDAEEACSTAMSDANAGAHSAEAAPPRDEAAHAVPDANAGAHSAEAAPPRDEAAHAMPDANAGAHSAVAAPSRDAAAHAPS